MVSSVFTPKTQPQSIAPKTTTAPTVKGTTTFEKFTGTNQPPKQSIDWSSVKTGGSSGTPTKKKSGSGGSSSTPTTFETFVAAPVIPTQSIQPPVVPPKTRESVVSFEKAKERTSGAFNTVFNVDKDNKQSVDIIKKPVSDMKRDSTFFESFIDNKQSVMPETRTKTVYQVQKPDSKTLYQMTEQRQQPQSIDRTIQLKNLNRKIAEYNQQLAIMSKTSPMVRDEKLEKELKDKQNKLFAELETTKGVTKKGDSYYIETPTGVMTVDRIGDVKINQTPTSFSIPETYPTSISDINTAFEPINKEFKNIETTDKFIKENIKDFEAKKKDYENLINFQTVKTEGVISELKQLEQKNNNIKLDYDNAVATGNYKEANRIAKEYNKNLEKDKKKYDELYSEYQTRTKRLDELEKTQGKDLTASYNALNKTLEIYNKDVNKYNTATAGYDALVKQYETVVNKPEASLKLSPEELQREIIKSKSNAQFGTMPVGTYTKLPDKYKAPVIPVFEITKRKIDYTEPKKPIGGLDMSISAVKKNNINIEAKNYLSPSTIVNSATSYFKKETSRPLKEKQFELPKNVLYNIGSKAIATPYYTSELLKSYADVQDVRYGKLQYNKPSISNTLNKLKTGVSGGAALFGSQFSDILVIPYKVMNKDKVSIYDYSTTKYKNAVGDISTLANTVTMLQGASQLASAFNTAQQLRYTSKSKYISGLGNVFKDLNVKYTEKELSDLYKASRAGKLSKLSEFKTALSELGKKDITGEGLLAGRKEVIKTTPRLMQVSAGNIEEVKPLLRENIINDILSGVIQKSSFKNTQKIDKAISPVLTYSRPGEKGIVVGKTLYSTLNLGKGKSVVVKRVGNELTSSFFSNERLIGRTTEDILPTTMKITSAKKTVDYSAQGIEEGFLKSNILKETAKKGKLISGESVRPLQIQETKAVGSQTSAYNFNIADNMLSKQRLQITNEVDTTKPYIEDLLNLQGTRDTLFVTKKGKGVPLTEAKNYFGYKFTIKPELPKPTKLQKAKTFIKSKTSDFIAVLEKIDNTKRFNKPLFRGSKRGQISFSRQQVPQYSFTNENIGQISKSKLNIVKTPSVNLPQSQLNLIPQKYNVGKTSSKLVSVIKMLPGTSNILKTSYKSFVVPKINTINKVNTISKIGLLPKISTTQDIKPVSIVGTLPKTLTQTGYKTAAITKIATPTVQQINNIYPTPNVPPIAPINTPWPAILLPKGFPGSGSNTLGKNYRGKRKSVTDKYLENYFARLTKSSVKQKIQNYKI